MNEFHDEIDARRLEPFNSLEAIVGAAGGYIQPTDDLRPSTLEAAREATTKRRWNFRIGTLASAVVLMAIFGLPGRAVPTRADHDERVSQAIRGFDLHRQASLRIVHAGFDSSWAMYEAFADLRKKQAHLFDAAM